MKFSVIYTVSCTKYDDVKSYFPSNVELFEQTEGDEEYPYDYLEGDWEGGHHAKLVALLDRKQFDEFISSTGLIASHDETGGAIGAPGFGMDWAPAIHFRTEDDFTAIVGAYVVPIPEVKQTWSKRSEESFNRAWDRIKRAIFNTY